MVYAWSHVNLFHSLVIIVDLFLRVELARLDISMDNMNMLVQKDGSTFLKYHNHQ